MSDLETFAAIEARRLLLQMSAAGVKFGDSSDWAIAYLTDALLDAYRKDNNWRRAFGE